jgi:hypothetical protein
MRLLGSFEAESLGSIDVEKNTGHSVCVVAYGEHQKNMKKFKSSPTKVIILAMTDGLKSARLFAPVALMLGKNIRGADGRRVSRCLHQGHYICDGA